MQAMQVVGLSSRFGAGSRIALALLILIAPAAGLPAERGALTPRQTAREFLEACRAGDYERAAAYLDLGRLPVGERELVGPRLARQLKVVLDQKLWLDLEGLSAEPEGDRDDGLGANLERVGTIESGGRGVDVLLVRRTVQGTPVWLLSAETLEQVPALYEEFGFGSLAEWLPPVLFQIRFLELELWQWIGLLLLVIAAYTIAAALSYVLIRIVSGIVARSETTLDDRLVGTAAGPVTATLAVSAFYFGSFALRLALPVQQVVAGVCKALVVFTVTWLAVRLVDIGADAVRERLIARGAPAATSVLPMGARVLKVFLVIIAGLSALQNFGFNIAGLLAGLGVGGLAVALAAQKTFENLFGGIFITANRPVMEGQFCRFGDKIGTIEEIGLQSTRVRTLDRTVVTVPNGQFASLQIENFAARDRMRFFAILGLRYETSPDQLRYVLVQIKRLLVSHPKVLPDPARVRFIEFGAYSLNLEIFAYVETNDWSTFLSIREDLMLRIMDILDEAGTGFAFPSQTLYVGQEDGLDAERTRRAEASVSEWREREQLYLPDLPAESAAALRGSIPYPPEGAPRTQG